MDLNNQNHVECFYHALLILDRKLKIGTNRSDNELKSLLEEKKTFSGIFHSQLDLFNQEDTDQKKLEKLLEDKDHLKLFQKISKHDFQAITINDPLFPENLKKQKNITPVIYTKGNLSLLDNDSIAVVGSRGNRPNLLLNENLEQRAKEIIQRQIQAGYTIVSGLALGSDTLAHEYAIKNNAKTIAVIATPLDRSSTRANESLQEEIATNHLLISQYPIGIRTFPSHFAHRNLTTVSLAKEGITVILSDDRSGTRHAIRHCYNQGKRIYTLKENLDKGYQWEQKYKDKITPL
jgi:DNA processing protein